MKTATLFLIAFYQKYLSFPLSVVFSQGCRFSPTCSEYTRQAIIKHGTVKGLFLGSKRLLRCHPLASYKYESL